MSDLSFKLLLQLVDKATAPTKAFVASVTGGQNKIIASTKKATTAVKAFTSAETQSTKAAESIKKAVAPTNLLTRALALGKLGAAGLRSTLDRIGESRALAKEAAEAGQLGDKAEHSNHKMKALLRTLAETSEMGPMGHLLAHITPWLGAAAVIFGAVTAAKGLFGMASEAGQHGAEAAKGAQKAGLPDVRDYQRLSYAASIYEVEQEQLDTGLKLFNKTVYLASKGGKAQAKVLKDLGLNIRDAHKHLIPVPELVARAADRFSKMADGTRKSAIAQQAFGRSGLNMIPMLNKGGDAIRTAMKRADELGLVLGPEAAERAEQFVRAQKDMGFAVSGLKLQLGGALLPVLNAYIPKITQFIVSHRPQLILAFTKALDWIGKKAPKALAALAPLTKLNWGKFAADLVVVVGGVAGLITMLGGLGAVLNGAVALGIVKVIMMVAGAVLALVGIPVDGAVALIVGAIAAIGGMAYLVASNWKSIWGWIKSHTYVVEIVKAITGEWGKLPGQLGAIWGGIVGAMTSGADRVWSALPDWLKFVLKGALFTMRLAFGLPGPLPALPGLPKPAALPSVVRPSNDNGKHALGQVNRSSLQSLARGAPLSARSQAGAAAAPPAKAEVSGAIHLHITSDGQVQVKSNTSSPGVAIHINRGEAA